ncbi:MAG: AMP-binding protein, partial [Rhodothermales bacterium]|nr:AMP-binding protein [Rhodothermales bacterium]
MTHLLHQPVDEWASRTPDREAIRCGEDSLTYARLSESSDRLAQVLVRRGVRRGDRVGIYLDKGLNAAVSLYGIMKAGAAYVPLDPHAPATRLAYILRDCDIRVLVTDDSKLTVLEEISDDVPGLECLVGTECAAGTGQDSISWAEVQDAPPGRPAMNAVEKDLSYILYTSGSTGVPKGVVHTHRSALAWAEASTAAFGFRQDDRISNYAPLHFDLSTLDYFSTALAGGTTVVIPELVTKLPASLSDLIARERLTVFYTVP